MTLEFFVHNPSIAAYNIVAIDENALQLLTRRVKYDKLYKSLEENQPHWDIAKR